MSNPAILNPSQKLLLALKMDQVSQEISLCLYDQRSQPLEEFKLTPSSQAVLIFVMEHIPDGGPADPEYVMSLLDQNEFIKLYPYLGDTLRKTNYKRISDLININYLLDNLSKLTWKELTLLKDYSNWNF